ncbi:MAG: fibrobacter succinogenes major paralogous domain-containing protein [Candidatus Zixiibacteriota bacterium]
MHRHQDFFLIVSKRSQIVALFSVILTAFIIVISCGGDSGTSSKPGPTGTTVTDIDGNSYRTVTIGTQTWMAENLKVTRYRNGDAIPVISDSSGWESLTNGACCTYDNNTSNVAVFGRLYNHYAVADSRGIAPAGWHVPSDTDWQILTDYLGGYVIAGGKMKDASDAYWESPNEGATNSSGFSALPAGQRFNGVYQHQGTAAYFWSFIEESGINGRYIFIQFDNAGAHGDDYPKQSGFSIRCVKD